MPRRAHSLPHSACVVLGACASLLLATVAPAQAPPVKTVLVVYEPGPRPIDSGLGDARQLRQLLGHFHTLVTLLPADRYTSGRLASFDVTFWVGFNERRWVRYVPPAAFMRDAYRTERTFVWLNTGLDEFAHAADLPARYGFAVDGFDTTSNFDAVDTKGVRFSKTDPNANVVRVTDPARCTVLATMTSTRRKLTVPYVVRSGSFWCVVDLPFSYATESDRYLYFADLLHDILGEDHPVSHSALIRIEDTSPLSNPASLRVLADLLAERKVPFLVGVIPYYVEPVSSQRVPMSEKPDYVDAIRYMMEHNGTVVLHGTTHQFKGETASDYEFWDESRDRPVPSDNRDYVARKIRDGVSECLRNGIYPLVWETPHYSASEADYAVFGEHFSTAMEQRLVLDNLTFSQYFPYTIEHDMYSQRILPENLGYIPLDLDLGAGEAAVDRLLSFAKLNLAVRDGFASAFFHPFVNPRLLARLVDGIRQLGYTFVDVRELDNSVRLDDRAVVSGSATVKLTLADQYLHELFLNERGQIQRQETSEKRIGGAVTREVKLPRRWIYVAEPREYREHTLSLLQRTEQRARDWIEGLISEGASAEPAQVLFLFDPAATGGALNDQESLAGPFSALSIPLDRVPVSPQWTLDPGDHNLVVVPYNVAELLTPAQLDALEAYVRNGGNLITDFKNQLAGQLGIQFLPSRMVIERVRDRLYPEEPLRWGSGEVMTKFEIVANDEILASDDVTEIPVVIGRQVGDGKLIFFGTRFDPLSTGGFSRYPYLAHYVSRYCQLTPLLRRDQLEMYFDPGYRHTVSIEQLVPRWAANGIRVLHVAGWHEYPTWKYDYARLVRLAHANGILVYCWLEPPQVSQKFWQEHPEWREKNFKGEDVRPSWRYPVALTDPACLAATLENYRRLLATFDWDGVNIGELCFEAGRGMRDPLFMTPLHPSARKEFHAQAGFDPIELFDQASPRYWRRDAAALAAFTKYRINRVTQLHDAVLALVKGVADGKPGFQVVVTVYDSLAAPELRANLGVDARQIAALQSKYHFTLLVEDPATAWSDDPRRYEAIAARYAGVVNASRLALDLNILLFRPEGKLTQFPTRIQTGCESAWLVHSAARGAPRAVVYSESSVNQQDFAFLASAYAARSTVSRLDDGWAVNTPTTLVLQMASDTQEVLRDDERMHSLGGGRFLLPVGSYAVRSAPQLGPIRPEELESHLLSITGELLTQRSSLRSVDFSYRSEGRCIVTLSRLPLALFTDRRETMFDAKKGNGRWALILPPGEHSVLVVTESTMNLGVDLTSFWSSYLIALFAAVSSGLLLLLYVVVRVRRRRQAKAA